VAVFSTTVDSDDAGLVAAARDGDRQALAELMARHRPLVVSVCKRFLGCSELVEDAAQEACLQAMLGLDRLREPDRFGPWLAGIGINVCRHWLRQRPRESLTELELSGGSSGPSVASTEPGPEQMAESADIAGRVRLAVSELPSGQRSVVVGFYLSGLTYAETAAALGIGVPALKARLHKGRASLRHSLQPLWEEITMANASDVVEVRIADVRRGAHDAEPAAHVVLLEEVDGDRRLPIWIGPQEGMSMALLLEKVELPRPMAPQFMFQALRAVGARVVEVRIDRLAEKTFYAVAVIEGPSGMAEVDARPSDALHAALLADARVTVRRELFEGAASDGNAAMLGALAEKFPESARDIIRARRAAQTEIVAGQPTASPTE
jgi:RNA polymerase sigma factor (sigma-70 family)